MNEAYQRTTGIDLPSTLREIPWQAVKDTRMEGNTE